ncbi:MAG: hypothetical protein R3C31_10305 [Hyphomonadaceae bacterium]
MLRPLVAEVQELRTIKEEVDGLRALKVEVEELRPLTAEVETLRPLRAEVGSLRKKIDCLEPLVPQVETLRQEIAARNARCGTQIESPETNTNKRNYFLIVSPGRSATQWLTRGLNRHEKVLAIHATEFCRDKALLEGSQEERDSIQRRVAERAGAHAFTLDDYFDIIDDPMSDFAAIGNVHGRGDTEVLTDPSRFRRKYLMSYIVRHPVIRLRSIFSRWQFGNRQSDQTRAHMRKNFERVRGMLKSAESTYDLDFRKEDDWLFAYAVVYLLTEEAKYLRSTPFVMNYERLVTDHNYLKRGLEKATGGTVEFSPDYVSRLIRTGAVDQHNHDLEYSESLLASWIGWRRDLFESMIDQFSLRPSYSEFGYSV